MINKLYNRIEADNLNLATLLDQLITRNNKLLKEYHSGKNITREEQLDFDFENLPVALKLRAISHLDKLFPKYLKEEDFEAIKKSLLLYNKYRRGLQIDNLFRILKNQKCNIEIRTMIGLHLSNFGVPRLGEWTKLLDDDKNAFLFPTFLNKAASSDPEFALEIFRHRSLDKLELIKSYVPLKKAIFTIVSTGSIQGIQKVKDFIDSIQISEDLNKKEITSKIFNSPELKSKRNIFYSNSIFSEFVKAESLIENLSEEKYEESFSKIPFNVLLLVIINNVLNETLDQSKEVWSYILNWLDLKIGTYLHTSLKEHDIIYDSLNEKIITRTNEIELRTSFNYSRAKMMSIKKATKNNRLEIIENAVK